MINRILFWFGLMKISTAENLGASLHEWYVKCVQNVLEESFDVSKDLDALNESVDVWRENFMVMVSQYEDDFTILNKPEFKRGRK